MPRLNAPATEDVVTETRAVLDGIGAQLGFIPSMFQTLAANPTVLEVVTSLQSTLARVLDAKTRHTIALAVSEVNGCEYCLAMHSYVSSQLGGMSHEDIDLARSGSSTDPRRAAVARFAQQVVETRGKVSDADLAAVRGAGCTDAQILAIVTVTVQFLLTNFLNNVNRTEVDIPTIDSSAAVT
jgi:uncharacterized peroxidase-related enzyme